MNSMRWRSGYVAKAKKASRDDVVFNIIEAGAYVAIMAAVYLLLRGS